MLDIRDFRTEIRDDKDTLGTASPFNVITETLTLSNFSIDEISELYNQHTENTGQKFSTEAIDRVHFWSNGQPWLVNALARQVVEKDLNKDFAIEIMPHHIDTAAETIIKHWSTHIGYLLSELDKPKVSYIVAAALARQKPKQCPSLAEDAKYCLDLGLLSYQDDILVPSNNIYAAVIARALSEKSGKYLKDSSENNLFNNGKQTF
ncbi:MAG: hypothetical protein LBR22_11085 [Desulfovibrio sp.]|jgi:hypothetical protein|nr:hypothetical protein [Desulfovibrio sp.]